jgi:hypothetical protein
MLQYILLTTSILTTHSGYLGHEWPYGIYDSREACEQDGRAWLARRAVDDEAMLEVDLKTETTETIDRSYTCILFSEAVKLLPVSSATVWSKP